MLAIQFGLRWVERQKRDNQGRIFLNYDPYCFKRILSFLRCKLVEHPDHLTLPPLIKRESQAEFASLTQYLGLGDFISSTATADLATDYSFHEAIAMHLTSNNHVAKTFGNIGYAIVSPRLKIGRHFLRICIDSTSTGYQWLFLGVTSLSRPKQNMEFDATSFGWAAGKEYAAGQGKKRRCYPRWETGDELFFMVDVTEQDGRLSMACPRRNYKLEHTFCATQSKRQGNAWSFAIGASCDMCISISSVSSQDWSLLTELPTAVSASGNESEDEVLMFELQNGCGADLQAASGKSDIMPTFCGLCLRKQNTRQNCISLVDVAHLQADVSQPHYVCSI